jgi:hypothetical protein
VAKSKKKRKQPGKRSRFSLSPRGENALATVGVIMLVVVVGLTGWTLMSRYVFKADPAKAAQEQKVKAEEDARWTGLLRDGTVLRVDESRQDLHVDGTRWEALGLSGQAEAVKAAAGHYRWSRCFVYDAGTGKQFGWYTPAEGYKQSEKR